MTKQLSNRDLLVVGRNAGIAVYQIFGGNMMDGQSMQDFLNDERGNYNYSHFHKQGTERTDFVNEVIEKVKYDCLFDIGDELPRYSIDINSFTGVSRIKPPYFVSEVNFLKKQVIVRITDANEDRFCILLAKGDKRLIINPA